MRFILCAAAVVMTLTGCGSRPADPRGVARDEVLLQVVATGRADARPNEARFMAGVQTIAATSGEAGAGNAEKMNRVVAALRALGVAEDDLRTQSITMNRIDYGADRGRFQANNVVEVRLRDVTRAGAAIGAVTEAGANILSGPNLSVSDPEAATREAYAAAFHAARARAEAYAAAAEMQIARVLVIRDTGGQGPPMPYEGVTMVAPRPVAQEAAAPPVQAGSRTNEVSVQVDFALRK